MAMKFAALLKTSALSLAFAIFAIVALQVPAGATTINFDDLNGSGHDGSLIASPYQGYNWENFYVLDGTQPHAGDGYHTGVVSGKNIAYNGFGNFSQITNATPFTLDGGAFTAAYVDMNVRIRGYLNNVLVYDFYLAITTTGPTMLGAGNFILNGVNLTDIAVDRLRFNRTGLSQVVFENLQLTAVPIPAALPLFASALAFGGVALRRRKAARTAARTTALGNS